MKGFNFEKNLTHQENAVKSTLAVFEDLQLHLVSEVDKNHVNRNNTPRSKSFRPWRIKSMLFFDIITVYLYTFSAQNTFRVANSIIALTSN